jgi:hypothetical protein
MSLRAFHLFFIAISVVLAAFVAAWGTTEYRALHEPVYIAAVVASLAAAAALVKYATVFQRKTRHLS